MSRGGVGEGGRGFYEFFAGGGMARLGLGASWRCLFANDFDPAKSAAYVDNHGAGEMRCADVHALSAAQLPGRAALAWASFPCQDLSLAGAGAGLGAAGGNARTRSGAFWGFWRLMAALRADGRAPGLIVLENVSGLVTSHGGADFSALVSILVEGGYRVGAVQLDAADHLPQSRPRIFVVALDAATTPPPQLTRADPDPRLASRALQAAVARLSPELARRWVWWRLPAPPARAGRLIDLLEEAPRDVAWDSPARTAALIAQMSPLHRARLAAVQARGEPMAGTLYRRTRPGPDGARQVRSEVRFDGVAGCLRTPAGGSSRQRVLIVQGPSVRSRLLSAREAARLMGLPDSYRLPAGYTAAYHLAGDGVAVPVVRWLAAQLLEPLADGAYGAALADPATAGDGEAGAPICSSRKARTAVKALS